ncbi:MAG: HNH endonuclease [Enterobacteriaceae bacterium]|nr:HNH endonuclease [Enterobacteriaceae bacterium]
MPVKKSEKISNVKKEIVAELLTKAGARCSFNGCNEYLLRDSLTLHEYNASNVAHIVAKKKNGPRGKDDMPLSERNKIDNLMLVCRKHHGLIDNKKLEKKYPISLLKKYKKEHEDRIIRLTGLSPERKTKVITFKYIIGKESVKIDNEDIYESIHPYYPMENSLEINCTVGDIGTKKYYECIAEDIKNKVGDIFNNEEINHVSVFALAPIPLLACLGNNLSNKVKIELYQRHRTVPEAWKWPTGQKESQFEFKKIKEGKNKGKGVALILELSGFIDLTDIPSKITNEFSVYKISLKQENPVPTFLKSRKTLNNFKDIYQTAIRKINKEEKVKAIHLFPAIPAPIAVLCGRELLKKIDPEIIIYDNNKNKGGFYQVLKINK